jgi:hypothetical protein
VDVNLSRASGTLIAEWMHPVDGAITVGGSVEGGKELRFDVPFVGPAVLYLRKEHV